METTTPLLAVLVAAIIASLRKLVDHLLPRRISLRVGPAYKRLSIGGKAISSSHSDRLVMRRGVFALLIHPPQPAITFRFVLAPAMAATVPGTLWKPRSELGLCSLTPMHSLCLCTAFSLLVRAEVASFSLRLHAAPRRTAASAVRASWNQRVSCRWNKWRSRTLLLVGVHDARCEKHPP